MYEEFIGGKGIHVGVLASNCGYLNYSYYIANNKERNNTSPTGKPENSKLTVEPGFVYILGTI